MSNRKKKIESGGQRAQYWHVTSNAVQRKLSPTRAHTTHTQEKKRPTKHKLEWEFSVTKQMLLGTISIIEYQWGYCIII